MVCRATCLSRALDLGSSQRESTIESNDFLPSDSLQKEMKGHALIRQDHDGTSKARATKRRDKLDLSEILTVALQMTPSRKCKDDPTHRMGENICS